MSIVRNFNLYLNAGNGSAPYINANQYDQGEQWVFTLYKEDGTKYRPSTGAIVGIKADNRGIINTGTVDADGRVVINETQQMTAAAGIAIFELLIDGDSHGTANFLVNVEQRPGDNADLSDSDLSLIQQAVDSAEVIVEVIGDSDPSEVIGEHVDAWLDNHPEATTTVLDGAITAPKINQSLWDKLLVSEEASGAVASFDDGADDVPVSSLKVSLEPIQTGSGDPSPTNIRPISGHSSVTVEVTDNITTETYSVSLGQTVYGGTVDLATGVLTLTKGFKNITASDNVQTVGSSGHGWQVLNSSLGIPPLNTGENYSDGIICDRLKSQVGASSVADDLCFINSSGTLRFNLATVYADKTALFNALGEINVAYPIEPQTYQLTPQEVKTLLGYNNISSSGTVDVIYHADTKLYVDKMTAVDNNIIAPTEADFVSTRNYTVNDLVIVNDTLYKVTANIANGGTITPNSNVQQTTLGALIKALS